MIRALHPAVVAEMYDAGIAAVEECAADFDAAGWERPACGVWSAADTVRHLLTVARWYHGWLDRAMRNEVDAPFPYTELDTRTADALDALEPCEPVDAVRTFAESARRYLDRATAEWDRPFGYPRGTVTVGLHCGIAAVEWHLHAWDLARSAGREHRPDHPADLFTAAARCTLAADDRRWRSAVSARMIPLAARRSPWASMLTRTGRAS